MRTKFTKVLWALFYALLTAGTANAQFTISGEFRPRAEYRDGYEKIGDSTMKAFGTILGRSRLTFDYKTDKIQTHFTVQQAFVFGENNYSSDTITKNTINIYEAWLRYNFTNNLAVRVGRVGLAYDDSRIFGLSNWSEYGATHDLVMLEWQAPKAKYTGTYGFAINNTAPASTPYLSDYLLKNYKYMSYLYNQKKFFKDRLTISILGVVDAYQEASTTYTIPGKTTINWVINNNHDTIGSFSSTSASTTGVLTHDQTIYARGTAGATAGFSLNNLNIFVNGFYQGGHYKDGRKISAYFAGAWLSYRVVNPLTLLVGYEQLSGNNASDTNDLKKNLHGFATPFSTKHSFYGYMDLYSTYLGQDALHNGLNDLYGRATVEISNKTSLEATYRWFSLPYGYLPL